MSKSQRWLRRIAWLLFFCCALLLACYVFRAPMLREVARLWIANDTPTKSDVIVILGGGLEDRPFAAARLFHDGLAPKILYTDVRPGPTVDLGITLPEPELTRQVLLSNGVPESAMVAVGNRVTSTYDESRAVRAWMERTGAKSIIIPTDIFHTRRVRWVFRKELRNLGARIQVMAVEPPQYSSTNWWQREEGLIAFQNEWVKLPYYWIKY